MQKVGLIGFPIRHSYSPLMQQAGFDHLGLDIRYDLWETESANLGDTVQSLRSSEVLGANVTAPYKQRVIALLDKLNETASRIGAVNTIVKSGSQLIGYNTDTQGFLKALELEGRFDPKGRKVLLVGAGGAARAISFALVGVGIDSLTIYNRNQERAAKLASDLKFQRVSIVGMGENQRLEKVALESDLLINCTSIGMKHGPTEGQSPISPDLIAPDTFVYDIIYNPPKTPLILNAKKAGARTMGGLSMLVYQGVASFELWTGKQAPADVMMQAVSKAL